MSNASDSHNFSVILNAVLGFCKYFVRVSNVGASLYVLLWEFKIVLMHILSRVNIFCEERKSSIHQFIYWQT